MYIHSSKVGNVVTQIYRAVLKYVSFLQKSSVPSLAPPCECLNTGFDNCMLYPSGFCDCSKSCSFVKDYLQDEDQGNDRTQMVSMRSFSGLMTPVNGEGGQFSPSELENTLEVSKKSDVLFTYHHFNGKKQFLNHSMPKWI